METNIFPDEVEKSYKDIYSEIKNRVKNRKDFVTNFFLSILISSIFLLLWPISLYAFSNEVPTFLINILFSISLALVIFVGALSLYRLTKIKIKFNEKLFVQFFDLYTFLSEFYKNRNNFRAQKNALSVLDKIENTIERINLINTGFGTSEKLVNSINILSDSIPKYQEELESPLQDIVAKYLNLFKNLMKDSNSGDIDSFFTHVNTDYKKTEIKWLLRIKDILKDVRNIVKYVISVSITAILTYSIISYFKISVGADIGSALTAIVSFCLISGGIKRYILDSIDKTKEK